MKAREAALTRKTMQQELRRLAKEARASRADAEAPPAADKKRSAKTGRSKPGKGLSGGAPKIMSRGRGRSGSTSKRRAATPSTSTNLCLRIEATYLIVYDQDSTRICCWFKAVVSLKLSLL
ncbi:hypothetical protein ZWY2020_006246 [Hordeum vulgare]|nr:hypothetical protein ZWY2020_006246 [Hordeum vulgare]